MPNNPEPTVFDQAVGEMEKNLAAMRQRQKDLSAEIAAMGRQYSDLVVATEEMEGCARVFKTVGQKMMKRPVEARSEEDMKGPWKRFTELKRRFLKLENGVWS